MKRHLLICGERGVGKSTLIRRLLEHSTREVGGFVTKRLPVADENGFFPIYLYPTLQSEGERRNETANLVGTCDSCSSIRHPEVFDTLGAQLIESAPEGGIILMDEPFSALDPITRSQLQDELVNLQAKLRKTIVFVTHDMDEAVKIADRICILHSGDILQYDTPENILKNPADGFVSEFVGSKRIWSSPELIKAKDIMIRTPKITYPDVPMLKCIEKMRIENVDSLLVVDESEHLLGIIRARSIHAAPDKSEPVHTVMKPAQATADPNENIVALLKKVNSNNISNVPVVDENKRLLGLITNSSLVTTMSQQFIDFEEGEA